MKSYKHRFPFKLGTTSYILPVKDDSLVSNVSFLKDSFDMVQLLFFGREYLDEVMTQRIIMDLGAIRSETGLSYTIHMPSDLELLDPSDDSLNSSLDVIEHIISETEPLEIEGYILHVDRLEHGVPVVEHDGRNVELFQRALNALSGRLGGTMNNIYIENTTYDLTFFGGVIMRNQCRVCLDAGHLSLHKQNLGRFVEILGPRIEQVHLHGVVDGRDHQALTAFDIATDGALSRLLGTFAGSVIIEVYNFKDLVKSTEYIERIFDAR